MSPQRRQEEAAALSDGGRSRKSPGAPAAGARSVESLVVRVMKDAEALYRDLPWRRTRDPYAILVSEVMLQQTQVTRVLPYYERWLASFPTLESLAAAPLEFVLEHWQGLGYNRRAIALKRVAERVSESAVPGCAAALPEDEAELLALPGIGPATAAGIRAFAFDRPSTYIETNVRSVFLHELFPEADSVPDREIRPYVTAAVEAAAAQGVDARRWYYALLDYGAELKRSVPNPSRRSAHHTSQSRFEGSSRQKRAALLRLVMAAPGLTTADYAAELASREEAFGRVAPREGSVRSLLEALASEGFLAEEADRWRIA